MMVSDKAWIEKAKTRKAIRDEVRQRILGKSGVISSDAKDFLTGASQDQLPMICQLLAITDAQSPGNSALSQLISQFDRIGLGVGEAARRATTTLTIQDFSMKNLRESWFVSPAFFD